MAMVLYIYDCQLIVHASRTAGKTVFSLVCEGNMGIGALNMPLVRFCGYVEGCTEYYDYIGHWRVWVTKTLSEYFSFLL